MNNIEARKELIDFMKKASLKGYQCYILKEDSSYLYGFFITPNDNVIYIQQDYFGGWSFSFKYIPDQRTGSACCCLDNNPVYDLTITILDEAEKSGLSFAYKLKANFYKNSQQYLKKLWNLEDYIKIEGV